MGSRLMNLPFRTIMTNAGTPGDKLPASNWVRVGNENKARGGAEARAVTGTGTTIFLAIETATDPRSPDSGYIAMWSSGITGDGINGWATVGGFGEVLDQ